MIWQRTCSESLWMTSNWGNSQGSGGWQAGEMASLHVMLSFWVPHYEKDVNILKHVQWRPPSWPRGWSTWHPRSGWRSGFSLKKRMLTGELSAHNYLIEAHGEEETIFSEVDSSKMRGNRNKWGHGQFWLDIWKKKSHERGQIVTEVAQGGLDTSILGGVWEPTG